jgi:hypothetical protein
VFVFQFWAKDFSFFSTVSRLAIEPTQPPIQWVLSDILPGLKLTTRSSAEVKNGGAIRLHGVVVN